MENWIPVSSTGMTKKGALEWHHLLCLTKFVLSFMLAINI
ncbi:hypothetical protein WANA13_1228 [Wolbachia endosymbiont of Drosophila ananassae]|nr:hypothetical protein WANA13_1228 [Wolbachia endosymbiont of Drosophila ananassae]